MKSVPFMFYAIIACIVALLFAFGLLPKIGHMKKAYEMSDQGKQLGELTDGSEEEETDFDETDPRKTTYQCSKFDHSNDHDRGCIDRYRLKLLPGFWNYIDCYCSPLYFTRNYDY